MKSIRVKKTETGIVLDGKWVDLAMFAAVVVHLAQRAHQHPRAGDVEDVGLALMAALVGADPGAAPPPAVKS